MTGFFHNEAQIYVCADRTAWMLFLLISFFFRLPYPSYLGGVVAIKRDFYQQLNGFSNVFFGWGGEDDDLLMR